VARPILKRKLISLAGLLWLLSGSIIYSGCGMNTEEPEVKIEISLPEREYIIGGEMPLTVTYRNNTQAAITIKEPEKVWETRLKVTPESGMAEDEGFGRIYMSRPDEDTHRYVVERAEDITLKPDGIYSYKSDLLQRFPDMFPPGNFRLRVVDVTRDEDTLASDYIPVTIKFSRESVPRLMNQLGDPGQETRVRQWAARWIKEFRDDFNPLFAEPGASKEQIAASEESIKKELSAFRNWWATAQDSDEVTRIVRDINERHFKTAKEEFSDDK